MPVDEYGNPLYGNAFGDTDEAAGAEALQYPGAAEDQTLIEAMKERWGETLEDSDDEDESEDDADMEGEEGGEDEGANDGTQTPMTDSGTQSVSSLTSGMETPESIDLRKSKGTDTPETPQLFHVLAQKEATVGGALFGSTNTYDLSSTKKKSTADSSGVEVSMSGNEIEGMDDEQLKAKYEAQLQEQNAEQNEINAGVTSVMLEEQRKRKRKMQKSQDAKSGKKYKDFKF